MPPKVKFKLNEQSDVADLTRQQPIYQSVMGILPNITKDENVTEKIQEVVLRCNPIYEDTYAFIRCLYLYCYYNNFPFQLTEEFVLNCIRTLGTRSNAGKKSSAIDDLKFLSDFYIKEFQPIYNHQKFSLIGLTYFLPYIRTTIFTCISNNLKEHFFTRLSRFLKILFYQYCEANNIDLKNNDNWDIFNKFKKAVNEFKFENIPDELKDTFNKHRKFILPEMIDDIIDENGVNQGKSVAYDSECNPYNYVNYGFYMNKYYETFNEELDKDLQEPSLTKEQKFEMNKKRLGLFQPMSLKSSFIPNFLTMDTAGLISLMMGGDVAEQSSEEDDELSKEEKDELKKQKVKEEKERVKKMTPDERKKYDEEQEVIKKEKKRIKTEENKLNDEKSNLNKQKSEINRHLHELDTLLSKKKNKQFSSLTDDDKKKYTDERDNLRKQIKEIKKQIKIIKFKIFRLIPYSETYRYYRDNMLFLQKHIWNKYFKFSNKVFRDDKTYTFNFTLTTDGYGVSLLFVKKSHKSGSKEKVKKQIAYYIDEVVGDKFIPEEDRDKTIDFKQPIVNGKQLNIKDKKIVTGDKGKKFLIYLVDDEGNEVKYSANQRNIESLTKRNRLILLREKRANGIIEAEAELSKYCSKTVDYEKFKEYLRARHRVGLKVRKFYEQPLIRKLKLRSKIYRRKSEDKFINRMKNTFGNPSDIVVVIGNWGNGLQTMMKGQKPTLGSGLNKIIAKFFTTFLLDEYNTSKKCCNCGSNVEKLYMPIQKNGKIVKKEIHRLMRCSNCVNHGQYKLVLKELIANTNTCSSESVIQKVFNGGYLTRDRNSCLDMMNIVKSLIYLNKRPDEFKRPNRKEVTQLARVSSTPVPTETNAISPAILASELCSQIGESSAR